MKVKWSAGGKRDLTDIVTYIARQNPHAAIKIDNLLSAAAKRLRDFPYSGRPGANPGTRELVPHKSYRLIYEIHGETVSVLSVIHTARQWPPAANELS